MVITYFFSNIQTLFLFYTKPDTNQHNYFLHNKLSTIDPFTLDKLHFFSATSLSVTKVFMFFLTIHVNFHIDGIHATSLFILMLECVLSTEISSGLNIKHVLYQSRINLRNISIKCLAYLLKYTVVAKFPSTFKDKIQALNPYCKNTYKHVIKMDIKVKYKI